MTATPWWQGPLWGFDVEATGIDVRADRIVQSCIARTLPGCEPIVEAEYINPGVPMHPEATKVHGLTDAFIASYGNPAVEAIERLCEILADAVKARIPIVGMNLAYDFTMLHYECKRYGMLTVEQRAGTMLAPVIDAYVLDKYANPYRPGSRKLADHPEKGPGMATHYGVLLTDAHDAVADTIASVEVARRIGKRYPGEVGDLGAFRLHACQAEWRADQAAGLQDYFRRKRGQPNAFVDPCWPLCIDDTHHRGG